MKAHELEDAKERYMLVLSEVVKEETAKLSLPNQSFRDEQGQWIAWRNQVYKISQVMNALLQVMEI